MSYIINRLVKNNDSQGNEEVFVEIMITDDLGTYGFGHWLNHSEYDTFKADYDPADYANCINLSDFSAISSTANVMATIAESYLVTARANKEAELDAPDVDEEEFI